MQLLVSVADSTEAAHAVAGGADLIDAKDPQSGPLGAVSLPSLREIHAAVAGRRVVTAALGDTDDEEAVERAAFEYGGIGIGFVKVGFAGITSARRVEQLIAAAVRGASSIAANACGVVAVAYADTGGVTSVDPAALVNAAASAGATGVLLDTAHKDGPGLTRLLPRAALASWVETAHDAGLTVVALAGKVTAEDLTFLRDTGADIAGVRGAACEGGRSGRVVEARVRALSRCGGRPWTLRDAFRA